MAESANGFLSRHPMLRSLLLVASAGCALVMALIGSVMTSTLVVWYTNERVYEVSTAKFDPALEGRMVKLHLSELHTEGGSAVDTTFGLSRPGALLVKSDFWTPDKRVNIHALKDVSEGVTLAPRILSGVREMKFKPQMLADSLHLQHIEPMSASLPDALKPLVEDATPEYLKLRTFDTSNLAVPHVFLSFLYAPSPQKVNLYVTGRLINNVVHVDSYLRDNTYADHVRNSSMGMSDFRKRAFTAILVCGSAAFLTALSFSIAESKQRRGYIIACSIYAQLLIASFFAALYVVIFHEQKGELSTWVPIISSASVAVVCVWLTLRSAKLNKR